ncbi:hypothetical protein [Brachybacterium alimentarium]|nr:hypothetical protein CIK72_04970 [Brachybacterium alimentarium]
MEILRLAGPPGVGKSTIGWVIAQQAGDDGSPTAYLDIDQLGMCYPAPKGDPERWRLKERALDAISSALRDHGVLRLVVSGVACPEDPPPSTAGGPTTSLWLDAPAEVIRDRLAPRGWSEDQLVDTVQIGAAESDRAHMSWKRVPIGTLTLAYSVEAVQAAWSHSAVEPLEHRGAHVPVDASRSPGDRAEPSVVWVTGPRCAGVSSAGWSLAMDAWGRERRTGFVDAAQVGFLQNLKGESSSAQLALHLVAILIREFAAAGAAECIVVAPLESPPDEVRSVFPKGRVLLVRLDVAPEQIFAQALARTRGGGSVQAGDDLLGASRETAKAVAATAAEQHFWPPRQGGRVLDVSGSDPVQVAEQIRAAARS